MIVEKLIIRDYTVHDVEYVRYEDYQKLEARIKDLEDGQVLDEVTINQKNSSIRKLEARIVELEKELAQLIDTKWPPITLSS